MNRTGRLATLLQAGTVAVLALAISACPESEPATIQSLINHEAWVEVSPGLDPFDDHRPAEVECTEGGWGMEDGVFEVETDRCPYGTFTQPLLYEPLTDTPIRISLWHLGLFATPPTEGHVVVQIGDETLFQEFPAIPAESELWDWSGVPTEAHEAGSPIYFHLHNHGTNSWRLGDIEGWTEP
ncbi:MAG: hypothetical protein VX498_01075 [Myxococcota bacterium]|nr:hypothetical protein [Myxococcota bacterium]